MPADDVPAFIPAEIWHAGVAGDQLDVMQRDPEQKCLVFVIEQVQQLLHAYLSQVNKLRHRKFVVDHDAGIGADQVDGVHVVEDIPGVPSIRVRVPAPERFPQKRVDAWIREDRCQLVVIESFHRLLAVSPDVAGGGERDRVKRVAVHRHLLLERLDQSAHVVDAVGQFVLGKRRPGIANLRVIKIMKFRVRHAHAVRECVQRHVAVKIRTPEFERVEHGAFQHLSRTDREHLVRLEIVPALQVLKLERQVVHVNAEQIRPYLFPDLAEELKELFPCPPDDRSDVVHLELPDVHDRLFHIRQRTGLDVERAYQVLVFLLLPSVRIPSRCPLVLAFAEHGIVTVIKLVNV